MPQYLSDEWMESASQALAGSDALVAASKDLDLVIQYDVAGAPNGKVAYGLRFDHGTVSLEQGPHKDAPVSFSLDYDSAAAIAKGELSAQAAFMQGRLKLGGDVGVLIHQAALLDELGDSLAELRDDTQF